MRLIPVMDLKQNQVVHAVKGERQHYLPVKSVLCNTAEPRAVAKSFRDRLGLVEIYIADLDAIQGCIRPEHRAVITALAHQEKLQILLDAGVSDVPGIQDLLHLGVRRVIVGAETLPDWDSLYIIPAAIPADHLVFSLDMRAGKILSRCLKFGALSPLDALQAVQSAGWKEVILLDLDRVGSGAGVDRSLVVQARTKFSELNLIAGGGIAGVNELMEMDKIGIAGVLVATALHNGAISSQHIIEMGYCSNHSSNDV